MKKMTFGVIVGNPAVFPAHLAKEGRDAIIKVLNAAGHNHVVLSGKDTQYGAVVSLEDAKKCAELFKANAEKIDGIIVTLPNFGEEKGILETLKKCGLQVPILIQAEPDTAGSMTIKDRRDSFCGKMSACNNLRQANIPYTLTRNHTVAIESKEFARELAEFAAVCRVVKGLTNCRIGAIGARPAAFNTVRYSEKLLEGAGITVETIDLSEVIGQIDRMSEKDKAVTAKLASIKKYVTTDGIPAESLMKIAKFAVVVDKFIKENELNATAIQCWTSLETYFGITPCTLMSMMSEGLVPSACEVDVTGAVSMYALQLASGVPSALLDWNNNYGDDPDKCILFHCSNLPRSFFIDPKMDYQEIIAGTVGKENTYGTIVGRVREADATFCRVTTDDVEGIISCYIGQGQFTKDKLATFGGYGVMRIPNLQVLMQYICRMGFEHHVAVSMSTCADAIAEALDTYMGWEVYRHI